jgi:hypothetical protein
VEEMKKTNWSTRFSMCLAIILALNIAACSFSPASPKMSDQSPAESTEATSSPLPKSTSPSAPAGDTAGSDPLAVENDPLDNLLTLRSVQFILDSQYPDGSRRTIQCEIDNAGNMHILTDEPAMDDSGMPKERPPQGISPQVEIFVLDGMAYTPDDLNPDWKTVPVDENFVPNFAIELHGMDGPALWLNLLPAGSIIKEDNESVGGFDAQRYRVQGKIGGEDVSGVFWKTLQTNALVQMELHIPAALFNLPDEPSTGKMIITLKAQKVAVDNITLPQ